MSEGDLLELLHIVQVVDIVNADTGNVQGPAGIVQYDTEDGHGRVGTDHGRLALQFRRCAPVAPADQVSHQLPEEAAVTDQQHRRLIGSGGAATAAAPRSPLTQPLEKKSTASL